MNRTSSLDRFVGGRAQIEGDETIEPDLCSVRRIQPSFRTSGASQQNAPEYDQVASEGLQSAHSNLEFAPLRNVFLRFHFRLIIFSAHLSSTSMGGRRF